MGVKDILYLYSIEHTIEILFISNRFCINDVKQRHFFFVSHQFFYIDVFKFAFDWLVFNSILWSVEVEIFEWLIVLNFLIDFGDSIICINHFRNQWFGLKYTLDTTEKLGTYSCIPFYRNKKNTTQFHNLQPQTKVHILISFHLRRLYKLKGNIVFNKYLVSCDKYQEIYVLSIKTVLKSWKNILV